MCLGSGVLAEGVLLQLHGQAPVGRFQAGMGGLSPWKSLEVQLETLGGRLGCLTG